MGGIIQKITTAYSRVKTNRDLQNRYTLNIKNFENKMKSLSLVLCTLLVAVGSNALPQYGQPQAHSVQVRPPPPPPPSRGPRPEEDLPEGCRYEHKLVQTIVEVETEKQVCNPYKDRVCDTKYRQAC